jgi:heme-degrading monooxygenase HmoA
MSVVVVNKLTLSVPAKDLRDAVAAAFPAVFDACDGFERFIVAQTAEREVVAMMFWDTAEHATAGAAAIGPTVASVVGSSLINQDRTVGEIVTDHTSSKHGGWKDA